MQARFELEVDAKAAPFAQNIATENFDISKARRSLHERGAARIKSHEPGRDAQARANTLGEVMSKAEVENRAVDAAGVIYRVTAAVGRVEYTLVQANSNLRDARKGFTEATGSEIER